MRVVVRSLVALLLGAFAGGVFTILIAPNIITWYQTTSDPNAMCNCVTTAHNSVRTMVQAQAIGGAVGGILSLILSQIVFRPRRREPEPQQKPAAPS
jgi:hypothetical protein